MNQRYVIQQAPYDTTKAETPAFVKRATRSPTFGERVFETVQAFAGKYRGNLADAQAWVRENQI